MAVNGKQASRKRGFFAAVGRAVDAHLEFQRLNSMTDESLAAMNLSREQIPQYIISRL